MNNLPKVVTQQRRGRASNPRLLDRKSDALPLSHRATPTRRHCKSPFPSAGTTVSLFRAKTVQQRPVVAEGGRNLVAGLLGHTLDKS